MPVHERRPVRVERAHLGGGQRRQDRPAAGGQVRRQPDPDVGDQRRPAGGPLLEHVEHVAAVQHRQVGGLPDAVDQRGEVPAGDPLQRLLAGVAAAHLERRHPEPVAVLVGQVHHEALLDHRAQQVVGRRARQPDRARPAGRGSPGRAGRRGSAAPAARASRRVPGSSATCHRTRLSGHHDTRRYGSLGSETQEPPRGLAARRPGRWNGAMTHTVTVGRRAPSPSTTWSRSPATAPPSSCGRTPSSAIERARRAGRGARRAPPTPAYGISTGFGALATRHIPTEMRAQLQRSLVRSHAAGCGPEVEREVVRGADAAAALDAGDRPHRHPARDRAAMAGAAQRTASPRWCTSTARSAAPATSRRSSHCALALMGEGEVARRATAYADAGRRRARRGRPRAGRAARPRRASR